MKLAVLESILGARASGDAMALVTALDDGEQYLVSAKAPSLPPSLEEALLPIVREAIERDRSAVHEIGGRQLFVQVFNRPLRLIVTGAVHIAQALVPIAQISGFKVVVVDPRTAFASAARFPGTELNHQWPDEALPALDLDHRTAVVTLSHDPKIDDPALETALGSPVFYIGSLGSRKTHAARLERLQRKGFDDQTLARIHAPVGLDINAQSTAEIAVAIVAEVVKVLRGR